MVSRYGVPILRVNTICSYPKNNLEWEKFGLMQGLVI